MTTTTPSPRTRTGGRPGRLAVSLLALPLALLACDQPIQAPELSASAAVDRAQEAATYRVTVHNTTGALQPLSPPPVAIHNPGVSLYDVGATASVGVERIAEGGDFGPMVSALEATNQVFDVAVAFGSVNGDPGPILPGTSASVEVQGPPGLRLSLVAMLACTNDGFTGLRSVRLPRDVGETLTYGSDSYDAGTEQNTEAIDDLAPGCVMATTGSPGGTADDQPSVAEDDVIRAHPGIDADTDGDDILDAQHQWSDPSAMIEIERIG